ncbi:MAG: hypothetical protein LBK28_00290 [Propionibacteriaceae bacterium]|jgi:hypothetical protein|nr:hypothetical protein [Propionibacteriaceae bacterium]
MTAFRMAISTGANGETADRSRSLEDSLPRDQQTFTGSEPERAIALKDFDCRAQTDYWNRLVAIHRDLERQFVDQNRSALDQMAASIEADLEAAGWR